MGVTHLVACHCPVEEVVHLVVEVAGRLVTGSAYRKAPVADASADVA